MTKVYMFRHQRAGIVATHVFSERPTEDQIAPIKAECDRLHGREGWGIIHEAELLGAGDVPVFPERPTDPGRVEPVAVSGSGSVSISGQS